jgi:hypothetical protein
VKRRKRIIHDWRNLGSEEAKVALEIEPAARFEEMIHNFFGLAQDGKTSARGMPRLLQLVLLAREFDDVVQFHTTAAYGSAGALRVVGPFR